MTASSLRAGRWPLALALTLLGACADETTSPTLSAPLRPNAAAGDVYLVTTPYDNGAIGSLRWALKFTTGGETIRFDPSLAGQTVSVDSLIRVAKAVTIEGPAGAGITISGAGSKDRLFQGDFGGTMTFRNVTVTGFNSGTGVGPVLYDHSGGASVVLENSLVHGNTGGGGNIVYANKITLINSTVSNNAAGNISSGQQYGALEGDTVTLVNSTVANNGDAGVNSWLGPITLRNSIITNHPRNNCYHYNTPPRVVREGTNISDDDTCGGPSEIVIADPKLAALADNGGPTMTHALLVGSPAINAGTACSVTADQRYFPRDAQCDVGAFEFADFTTVEIAIDPTTIIKSSTGWAVLTGTVTCSRNETFELSLELAQEQKKGSGEVHAASTVPVQCTTTPRMWSASMVLTDGAFQVGTAAATAYTLNAEKWVAPASASGAVKLFRSK